MTAPTDPHVQAFGEALIKEHEARIAEIERRAAEAAARDDDEWNHRRNLEHAAQLRAMRYPWESESRIERLSHSVSPSETTKAMSFDGTWPLTWVGDTGIEPMTSSV